MKKRLLPIISLLLMMCLLTGCKEGLYTESTISATQTVTVDYSQKKVLPTETLDKCKISGRYSKTGTSITFDNSANGISFVADCKGDISLDMTVKALTYKTVYFTVIVDGVTAERKSVNAEAVGSETKVELKVAADLQEGEHTFTIYRQTESLRNLSTIDSINLNGIILDKRPTDNSLLIEFVGDSITCGYGNLGNSTSPGNANDPQYQDSTQTYAFLTAQNLNADASLFSTSGIGVSCGYIVPTMPPLYGFASPNRNQTDTWTFDRKPNIVVINLGTNDSANMSGKKITNAVFREKAAELIKNIQAKLPDAKIVWAYGSMGSGLWNDIIQVITELGGESKGIYGLKLATASENGAGGHPSLKAHKEAATVLTAFLKEKGLA